MFTVNYKDNYDKLALHFFILNRLNTLLLRDLTLSNPSHKAFICVMIRSMIFVTLKTDNE